MSHDQTPGPAPQPGWNPPPPPQQPTAPVAPIDPRRLPPHLQPSLPVEERDYFAFWRAPRYRWWKGILAALLAAIAFFAVTTVLQFAGWLIDGVDLSILAEGRMPPVGPGFFLGNNVALALCIAVAGLVAWLCVGQRPRWMSSVSGGVRWKWLFTLLIVFLPIWAVVIGTQTFLGADLSDLRWREHTLIMIVGILLTTPFQAAGEEYLVRGMLGRVVGSWFGHPVVGFVASTIVTAVVFMALHGAGDPWLNAFYLVFAVVGSWVTWRTGGLEAAVAIHVVNNVVAMTTLPFSDFSDMFNREAGVGDASLLINMATLVVAAGIVELLARRFDLAHRSAPGRRELEALAAPRPASGGVPGQPW